MAGGLDPSSTSARQEGRWCPFPFLFDGGLLPFHSGGGGAGPALPLSLDLDAVLLPHG
jgi:hypothetical protein